jgi:adenylate cyclase
MSRSHRGVRRVSDGPTRLEPTDPCHGRHDVVCVARAGYSPRMGKLTPQEEMQELLDGHNPATAVMRRVFSRVPSGPNCKICAAPFAGPGGAVLRHVGFGRYSGNPTICQFCIKDLQKMGIQGAEIPVSLMFADIRGSTTIGERLSPTDFQAFLSRFYRIASQAVLASDGMVDKFVGDEVIGLFFRGITGDGHAASAIEAARRLLAQAGRPDATPSGRIPVGAAVHTGMAFVGSTAAADVVNDFTALGDSVNTTARLASAAADGELLVSVDAAEAAGLDGAGLEHRTVMARGRSETVDVIAVPVGGTSHPD